MLATITEYITRLTMPSRLETTRKVLAKGEEEIERFVELHRQLLSVIERRQVDEIATTSSGRSKHTGLLPAVKGGRGTVSLQDRMFVLK